MDLKGNGDVDISNVAGNNRGLMGDVNITVIGQPSRRAVENYAEGTIGRNADMLNYVGYLTRCYCAFRMGHTKKYNDRDYRAVHDRIEDKLKRLIQKKVGAYPEYLPQKAFPSLVRHMHEAIDGTFHGKSNKKKGIRNYKPFEEFCAQQEK